MLNFLWMLLAFAVLTGIAMVFYTHGRYSSVEGLLLAMGTVILVLLAAERPRPFPSASLCFWFLADTACSLLPPGQKAAASLPAQLPPAGFFSPGYVLILAGFSMQ